MDNSIVETRAGRFFWAVTAYPKTILVLGILLIIVSALFLPRLTKDTSPEALISPDHPSVVYRNKVKELFGLSDPVLVCVINKMPNGVFNQRTLQLISWWTERVADVEGVDPERITSLATENNIFGDADGMRVEPFFETPPQTQEEADRVREAVWNFPLYIGNLVAHDGTATLIVAELLDEKKGEAVYAAFLELAKQAPLNGEEIYVAGEGAVSGYLGKYIDTDARRLNMLAGLIISAILLLTYRTLRGLLMPNFVVLGAVAVALGSMAAAGVPFYIITNGLTVILIAIGVADGIHILGQYYEEIARRPDASQRELVVRSMVEMWRPVTFTSVTDCVGFMALSVASYIPPMKAFGIFASIGVLAALMVSLFVLPAWLVLMKPRKSPAFRGPESQSTPPYVDRFGRIMAVIGRRVIARPGVVLAIAGLLVLAGTFGALRLEVNESRIENFKSSEPLYQADRVINLTLDGSNYLDVVIETPEPEGLFNPENLQRLQTMQQFFETLPHVKGTTSIVDFLKQMNRAMNENRSEAYRLPTEADLIAQYFLLYSASSDPTDFEAYVDYDYRLANLRVTLDSGRYSDIKVVVEAAEQYIQEEFNTSGITANLAGRVNVDYHWILRLRGSHFRSLAFALLAVWFMSSLSFRSAVAGALAVVPVCMAVLLIYAVMGFFRIWLGVGTSMFAAIAIGTSVDFSIHTLDRLMVLGRNRRQTLKSAFLILFPSTGRALLFSFLALFLGFGVLTTSQVPPLIRFGSLVGVCALASFGASLTVLPALVHVIRPAFLGFQRESNQVNTGKEARTAMVINEK